MRDVSVNVRFVMFQQINAIKNSSLHYSIHSVLKHHSLVEVPNSNEWFLMTMTAKIAVCMV